MYLLFKVPKLLKKQDEFNEYIRTQIAQHKNSFDRGNIRDFIDLFIDQESNQSEDDLTGFKLPYVCPLANIIVARIKRLLWAAERAKISVPCKRK